jgi:hypothetical protein
VNELEVFFFFFARTAVRRHSVPARRNRYVAHGPCLKVGSSRARVPPRMKEERMVR